MYNLVNLWRTATNGPTMRVLITHLHRTENSIGLITLLRLTALKCCKRMTFCLCDGCWRALSSPALLENRTTFVMWTVWNRLFSLCHSNI